MPSKKDVIDYSVKYIYRYPKTEKELIAKLREKKYTEEEINKAVEYLKKQGWLNDSKFADMYIYSELIKKGKPIYVVKGKLLQKGVDKNIIENKLREYEEDIGKGISKRLQKEIEKYKSKGLDGFAIIQKLLAKGYKLSDIKRNIK